MITKAALLVFRGKKKKSLLFVRAKQKTYYVLPGGKQERGETIEQALMRELKEELNTAIKDVANVGTVEGFTPEGDPLKMYLYRGELVDDPSPHSEIDHLRWFDREAILANDFMMTPMTLQYVVPFIDDNSLWE